MAMTRPLMQLGIGDLEDIFDKQIKNSATLGRLKDELSRRHVPRAIALLQRVQQAEALLKDAESDMQDSKSPRIRLQLTNPTSNLSPVSASSIQIDDTSNPLESLQALHGQLELLTGVTTPLELGQPRAKPASSHAPASSPTPHKSVEPEALPQLSLEDAYRILKVGVGDGWVKIENARRKIVLKSNPAATSALAEAQLEKLLAEAKMANDAAIVIAARRSGRQ